MIVEHALLSVAEDGNQEFEAAFKEAQEILGEADGFHFVDLMRQTDDPGTYLLIVAWASHEQATDGFRGSEVATRWNAALKPFLVGTPEHRYFQLLAHYPTEG